MRSGPVPVNPVEPAGWRRHEVGMTAKDEERKKRLAAALRENLRRRKAQSREKTAEEKPESDA